MYDQPSSKYGIVIRVDEDVHKRIKELQKPGESINAVLRRAFGLEVKQDAKKV